MPGQPQTERPHQPPPGPALSTPVLPDPWAHTEWSAQVDEAASVLLGTGPAQPVESVAPSSSGQPDQSRKPGRGFLQALKGLLTVQKRSPMPAQASHQAVEAVPQARKPDQPAKPRPTTGTQLTFTHWMGPAREHAQGLPAVVHSLSREGQANLARKAQAQRLEAERNQREQMRSVEQNEKAYREHFQLTEMAGRAKLEKWRQAALNPTVPSRQLQRILLLSSTTTEPFMPKPHGPTTNSTEDIQAIPSCDSSSDTGWQASRPLPRLESAAAAIDSDAVSDDAPSSKEVFPLQWSKNGWKKLGTAEPVDQEPPPLNLLHSELPPLPGSVQSATNLSNGSRDFRAILADTAVPASAPSRDLTPGPG